MIIFSFIIFIFLGIAVAVFKLPFILNADNAIGNFIFSSQTISGVQFWSAVTFLGNKETIIVLSIFLLLVFYFLKKYRDISILAVTVVGAELSGLIAKNLFQRVRPITALPETSFSFPSGHATLAMAFFGILIYFVHKNIKTKSLKWCAEAIFGLVICMIGYSRLYLGMHWFTDILGGYFLGFFWVLLGITVGKKFFKEIHEQAV